MAILKRAFNCLRYRWQHREPWGSGSERKRRAPELKQWQAEADDLVQRIGIAPASMTGADRTDYLFLHRYITARKPDRVLELGGGVTTLVMAHAMHEAGHGELVTVEHIKKYADETKRMVPAPLNQRVTFVHTSVVGDRFNGMPVFRFDEVPGGHYDMMFCDHTDAIGGFADGPRFAHVDPLLMLDDRPTDIITDRKLFSLRKYANWLSCDAYYDPILALGFSTAKNSDITQSRNGLILAHADQMLSSQPKHSRQPPEDCETQ